MPNGDRVRLGREYISFRLEEYETVPRAGEEDGPRRPRGPSLLRDLLDEFPFLDGRIRPLVTSLDRDGLQELWMRAGKLDETYDLPPLDTWYAVSYTDEDEARKVVAYLDGDGRVRSVSVVRAGPDPCPNPSDNPLAEDQTHLEDAEGGVGARSAWQNVGADGTGVAFADIEQGWTVDHRDLADHGIPAPLTGTIVNTSRAHGTQVLGVVCAVNNTFDGVGIAYGPKAVYVASRHGTSVADAVAKAADTLAPGDVILLEVQDEDTETGLLIPVEVDEGTYDSIRLATALQISVVEVAGNGNNWNAAVDLDKEYPVLKRGFAALGDGSDEFRDSRAVMVAAARHLAKEGGAEEWYRRNNSNYGSRIDCFAQGEAVVSCSSDDLGSTTAWSKSLCMTSAAAAIVAGAAVALQGMARQTGAGALSPLALRDYLADFETGTLPALDETTWIGVMPDLAAIHELLQAKVQPLPVPVPAVSFAWRVANLCGEARAFTVRVLEEAESADEEFILQDRTILPGCFRNDPSWAPAHTPKRYVEATAGDARCCLKVDGQFARIEVRLEATGVLTIELRDASWQPVGSATGDEDCPDEPAVLA